jgi:hypothetical protein
MRTNDKRKMNAVRLLKEATERHRPVHVVHLFESSRPAWETRRHDLHLGRDHS